MDGTVIKPLVDYLATLGFEDIPCEVLDKAKLCISDTLGVSLAGSTTSIGKLARQYAVNIGDGRKAQSMATVIESLVSPARMRMEQWLSATI